MKFSHQQWNKTLNTTKNKPKEEGIENSKEKHISIIRS